MQIGLLAERRGLDRRPQRPAAITFATGERYVIRLILRICLSKIRAGTRRRSMLTRPAPEPAGYRSFGFGSVAAATITLAITAGGAPGLFPPPPKGSEGGPPPPRTRRGVSPPPPPPPRLGAALRRG